MEHRKPLRLRRVGLVLAVVAVLGTVAAWGQVRSWLYSRDVYRLPVEAIEFDPPPPAWIKGGGRAILAEVRDGAGLGESVNALEVDLPTLRKALAHHSPWVREVRSLARRHPGRIVADVEFRRPLAEVQFAARSKAEPAARPSAVVDADGVVLPRERLQLDGPDRPAPLLIIKTSRTPTLLRPGQAVQVADASGARTDRELVRACELAAALDAGRPWPEAVGDPVQIDVLPGGLYVWFRPGPRLALWKGPDDAGPADDPGDRVRSKDLAAWAEAHDWPPYRTDRPQLLSYDQGRWNLRAGVASP